MPPLKLSPLQHRQHVLPMRSEFLVFPLETVVPHVPLRTMPTLSVILSYAWLFPFPEEPPPVVLSPPCLVVARLVCRPVQAPGLVRPVPLLSARVVALRLVPSVPTLPVTVSFRFRRHVSFLKLANRASSVRRPLVETALPMVPEKPDVLQLT